MRWYAVSGVSRTAVLGTMLGILTLPIAAQRGGGPGQAPRPTMLDDSDVVLKPPFANSPDLIPNPNAPQGKVHRFTQKSEDSKIYKGISRDKPGEVVPYERPVAVYIPAQYVPGTAAPFIVVQDGYNLAFGARFLKRVIEDRIKLPISQRWNEATDFTATVVDGKVRIDVAAASGPYTLAATA